MVGGAGLVLDLPSLPVREPEIHFFTRQVPAELVTADLEILLGTVVGLLEVEPVEGEGEGADVICGEDDEFTV